MSDGKGTHHQIRHPESHAVEAGQEKRLRQKEEVQAMSILNKPVTQPPEWGKLAYGKTPARQAPKTLLLDRSRFYFWLGRDAESL